MSAVELVAGIVAAFFVIGIVVGVIAVIAMSAIRTDRTRRRNRPSSLRRRTGGSRGDRTGWEEPPGPDDEDDDRPRWPSGALSG